MGTLNFVAKLDRSMGNLGPNTCNWLLKWKQFCGTEPLNLWSLTLTQTVNVRVKLDLEDTQLVSELVGGRKKTFQVANQFFLIDSITPTNKGTSFFDNWFTDMKSPSGQVVISASSLMKHVCVHARVHMQAHPWKPSSLATKHSKPAESKTVRKGSRNLTTRG